MRHDPYQGFTNYETFCVHEWLNSSEYDYDAAKEIVNGEEDVHEAAVALQEHIEDQNPLKAWQDSMFTELLKSALEEVNYNELAEALWEEEDEEEYEDEESEDTDGA